MNRVLSPQLTQTPQFDTYPLSEMYNYRPEPPKYQIYRVKGCLSAKTAVQKLGHKHWTLYANVTKRNNQLNAEAQLAEQVYTFPAGILFLCSVKRFN